jgi:hypothetical protein
MAAAWVVAAVLMMFLIGIFCMRSQHYYIFLSIAIRGRRPLWVCAARAAAAALCDLGLVHVGALGAYPGLLFQILSQRTLMHDIADTRKRGWKSLGEKKRRLWQFQAPCTL